MNISELTYLVDMTAPVSLIAIGWLFYLQTQSQIHQRTGVVCALVAIVFPAVALSDPGMISSLVLNIAGAIGIGTLRWRSCGNFRLQHKVRSKTGTKDPSTHPISTDKSSWYWNLVRCSPGKGINCYHSFWSGDLLAAAYKRPIRSARPDNLTEDRSQFSWPIVWYK